MNRNKCLPLLIFAFCTSLAACGGSSTQVLDYTPLDNSPKLDMKASIYTTVLPSGNTLTLTTDQSGTSVFGAYTIKNSAGTIISSGKIDNLVTSLSLTGFPGGSCPTEAISIKPDKNTISAASDSATSLISGFSCSEGNLPVTRSIKKLTPTPASARMYSQGNINSANQVLEVSVKSGDNVNFVGYVTMTNNQIPVSATGTIVGTITTTAASANSGGIVTRIDDPAAYGFAFTRMTNFSGHFFSTTDNIQLVTGNVKTAQSNVPGQYFINEITVQATDSNGTTTIGPTPSASINSYTPQ